MKFRAALIVLSDRAASGARADECIPLMRERLGDVYAIVRESVLPDDPAALQAELIELADSRVADLVITSGGTGLSPRDRTPQATGAVLDYEVPGIAEAIRAAAMAHTKSAMLSRALAGVRDHTLIVNLPGSPRAVGESLDVVIPVLPHALELLGDRIVDG
ncbi:MAG TPA: MogA/MoaB family molybdenum cofactor biosynthesis protein [Candidatus Acidoferrales bacterium]|jgi:molybdopterin adenylyltransferase|nr:MogA/MoaB family molybdenum cofactor biosynthesis protein [Candidatus Acidoferrales bacterium]